MLSKNRARNIDKTGKKVDETDLKIFFLNIFGNYKLLL
jgi:hypothetical protein